MRPEPGQRHQKQLFGGCLASTHFDVCLMTLAVLCGCCYAGQALSFFFYCNNFINDHRLALFVIDSMFTVTDWLL